MTFEEIHQRLAAKFGDRVGPLAPANRDSWAPVQPPAILEVCRFLQEDPDLAFDCLMNLSSVDWPKKNQIEVVYHFWSYSKQHSVIAKCLLDRGRPEIASIESVWKSADWLEREQFDLMGVVFTGHPDLRRKDYKEQAEWHNITTTRESPLDGFVRLDELVKKKASEKKEVLQ